MKSFYLFSIIIVLFIFSAPSKAELIIFPKPQGLTAAEDFSVKVNGKEVFVYDSKVAAFTSFAFDGQVDIEITPGHDVKWLDIRPLNLNIQHTLENNIIRFKLTNPCNLSFELNGESGRVFYLFANPIEKNPPKPTDKNTIYFESGKVHDIGHVDLKSNQTVYIADGAVVYGSFSAKNAKNINISGYGILDGSKVGYEAKKENNYVKPRMLKFTKCKDFHINGIVILDSYGWTVSQKNCKNSSITNIKHINWRFGSDGIDLVGSSDVTIDGCFLRDNDDCVTIKTWGGDPEIPYKDVAKGNDIKNITVTNTVFWNMAYGNAMEIGFELQADSITNISFINCDVIHCDRGAVMGIHHGDYATISNIRYEDIRIEDAQHKLIDFGIFLSQYSADRHPSEKELTRRYLQGAWDGVQDIKFYDKEKHAKHRGYIKDIYFKNIHVIDGLKPFSILSGFDDKHCIDNVTIENMTIHGKVVNNAKEGRFFVENTKNLKFITK